MRGIGILLVITLASQVKMGLHANKDDWIDPNDMLNYDPSTNTMKNKPPGPGEPINDAPARQDCPACTCTPCPTTCPECPEHSKPCVCEQAALPLLRQYVRTVLRHFSGQIPTGKSEDYKIHVSLSAGQAQVLQQFADTGNQAHVHDVHEILGGMVQEISSSRLGGLEWVAGMIERKLGITLDRLIQFFILAALASVVLLIEVKLQISWRRRITQLIVLMFFISVPWTWVELYRQAEIKQQSVVDSQMPSDCQNQDGNAWWSSLKSFFTFQEDKCLVYYEHMMIDPLVKVPPTKAIAITFVRFFVAPMKDVGGAISEFIRALLIDMPLTLYPIALGMVGFFVFLFMIMWFGYSIRLPFYILSFEKAPHQVALADSRVEQAIEDGSRQAQQQIETLRTMLESTETQLTDRLALLDRRQQAALECAMTPSNTPVPSPSISRTSVTVDPDPSIPATQSSRPSATIPVTQIIAKTVATASNTQIRSESTSTTSMPQNKSMPIVSITETTGGSLEVTESRSEMVGNGCSDVKMMEPASSVGVEQTMDNTGAGRAEGVHAAGEDVELDVDKHVDTSEDVVDAEKVVKTVSIAE